MIDIVSTTLVGDDTASILHEHIVVALDGHGNGTLLEGTRQLFRIHLRYVDEVSNAHGRLRPVSLATLTSQSLVWVVVLEHHTVILSISECTVNGTSQTALVTIDLSTVDELLLGKVHQGATLEEVLSLDESKRCESPVRTTDVLVLHRCHGTFLDPIHLLKLAAWIVALSAELSIAAMVALHEFTLS